MITVLVGLLMSQTIHLGIAHVSAALAKTISSFRVFLRAFIFAYTLMDYVNKTLYTIGPHKSGYASLVRGTIQGEQAEIIMDTGATISIISEHKLRCKFESPRTTATSVSGTGLPIGSARVAIRFGLQLGSKMKRK